MAWLCLGKARVAKDAHDLGFRSTFALLIDSRRMDLLQACDEMKSFIETAQKLVESWEADPDNYSKLEEGLAAMKAKLQRFQD